MQNRNNIHHRSELENSSVSSNANSVVCWALLLSIMDRGKMLNESCVGLLEVNLLLPCDIVSIRKRKEMAKEQRNELQNLQIELELGSTLTIRNGGRI